MKTVRYSGMAKGEEGDWSGRFGLQGPRDKNKCEESCKKINYLFSTNFKLAVQIN